MPKTICQSVTLPASAEKLFDMYMNPTIQGAFTGGAVTINAKRGSKFQAFDGMIFGKTLEVVPKHMIVQSWRGKHWKTKDLDSILILTFWPQGKEGRIELIHVNVADHDYEGVKEGWEKYYWKPWREYLEKNERKSAKRAA